MGAARRSNGLAKVRGGLRSVSPDWPRESSPLERSCSSTETREWLDALPSLAFIECGAELSPANALARDFIGTSDNVLTRQLLVGAYPAAGDGRRQRFECVLLPPGGRPTMVSGAVQPFVAEGKDARLVLLMEHCPTGPDLPQSGAELERTFLEDLFDSGPEAMVIVQGTRIVRANREFSRMFGYSMEECLGSTLFNLIIPEGRHHESEMLFQEVAATDRGTIDTVRLSSSGEELDVSITVVKVRLAADAFGLAVTYRDIGKQKQSEARLQHSAMHDPLTGLANRVLFLDRLTLTLARLERRPDRNFAIVFLDVDGFKQVNDVHGHATGDATLLAVTERLRSCLRPQDTIARFGGDEFVLLLDDVGGTEDIERVAGRIQAAVQRPVEVGGRELCLSASMGIALSAAGHSTAESIMRDADHAMYEAKAKGKARHEFFAAEEPDSSIGADAPTAESANRAGVKLRPLTLLSWS